MKFIFTFLIAIISLGSLKATIFTSAVTSGTWTAPSTWVITRPGVNTFPSNVTNDTVVILSGHTVKLYANAVCKTITVNSGGKLFSSNKSLTLRGNLSNSGTIYGSGLTLYFDATATMSSTSTFTLTGVIYVRNGATLTIASGTTLSKIGPVFLNTSSGSIGPKVINNGTVVLKRNGNTPGGIQFQRPNSSWTNASGSSLNMATDIVVAAAAVSTPITTLLNATANNNTVIYSGGTTNIRNTPYYNLQIISASVKTLTTSLTVLNNLSLSGTSNTVNIGANTLNIGGSLSTNAPLTFSTGKIVFNGTSAVTQTVSGTYSPAFYDLEVNNTGGAGVIFTASRTVSNDLIMTSGNLNANGRLTLVSTASKTARLAPITTPSNVSFTGNLIIQKHIPALNTGLAYYALSSPTQGSVVMDWDDEMYISGIGPYDGSAIGAAGVDGDVFNLTASMYTYDEPNNVFAAVTGSNTPLAVGTGYCMVLADTYGGWYAKTIDTKGQPNFGDILVTGLDYGFGGGEGWHLVGNPYACHIDYSLVTKSGIGNDDPNIYCMNFNGSNYDVFPNGTIIPPHQGFFTVTDLFSTGELTFTESCKVNSHTTDFYRRTKPNYDIDLRISSNVTPYDHNNTISFDDNATVNYDKKLDAVYRKFPLAIAPAIYMIDPATNKTMIKNSIDSKAEEAIIPLGIFTPVAGVYYIDASVLNLDAYNYAWIENKITGAKYDLNNSVVIEGKAQATNTDYVLRLSKSKRSASISETILESDLIIFGTENTINLKSLNSDHSLKEFMVYDMTGKLVMTQSDVNVVVNSVHQIDISSLANGIYVVKVIDEQGRAISKKIVK